VHQRTMLPPLLQVKRTLPPPLRRKRKRLHIAAATPPAASARIAVKRHAMPVMPASVACPGVHRTCTCLTVQAGLCAASTMASRVLQTVLAPEQLARRAEFRRCEGPNVQVNRRFRWLGGRNKLPGQPGDSFSASALFPGESQYSLQRV
jgi:hypothetical protein